MAEQSTQATTLLAVNGTLMRGLELNPNLLAVGATYVRDDETDACYRIWSIGDRHPAMIRTPGAGTRVALELWAQQVIDGRGLPGSGTECLEAS